VAFCGSNIIYTEPARLAAARAASSIQKSPRWRAAYRAEELWEINHFLSLMDKLQKAVQQAPTPA